MPAKRRQFGRGYTGSGWAKSPPPANVYAYGGPGRWSATSARTGRLWCRIRFPDICTDKATEVDHVIQPEDGGTNDPENLRAVCKPCHARRTGRQGALSPAAPCCSAEEEEPMMRKDQDAAPRDITGDPGRSGTPGRTHRGGVLGEVEPPRPKTEIPVSRPRLES